MRALLWKELRQARRTRGVLLSSTLMPLLLLVVMPFSQLFALLLTPAQAASFEKLPFPSGADLADPARLFVQFLFPIFLTLGGLTVPSIAATYTVVAERERGSLELLLALPVRVADVLVAKLLAVLVLAGSAVIPLFALDAAVLLALRFASPLDVALLFGVLLAALACAVAVALLLALLARDHRTANQLDAALVAPLLLLAMGLLLGLPAVLRLLALSTALLATAALALLVALRWLTFERYLG